MSREAWLIERKELLAREKAHARAGDELAAARRALPRVRVDKDYRFESATGRRTLAELFDGRSQLIVQHIMFGADWEAGCPICSFWADGWSRQLVHLAARDVTMVGVSRAPIDRLTAYRRRMDWDFAWYSCAGSDFGEDFGVAPTAADLDRGEWTYNYAQVPVRGEEHHGTSVFERDGEGTVYHTYSTYGRGLDRMNGAYGYLDLTPKGRDEADLPFSMAWVRRHDEY
ncbi:MAG: DUF899 domain-containing protein [Pseudomonadota bacterium]